MKFIAILAAAVLLAGCPKAEPVAAPAAPLGAGAPVAAATQASNAAQAAADSAERERLAKVRANVDAAAAAPHIEAAPVAVNELTVAQGRLADVTPDPVEVAAAAERRTLVEAGRAEEARANALAAADAARKDAARIAALESESATLRAERDRITSEFAAQAERNRVANDQALAAARDEVRNGVLRDQVSKLTWIGIGACGLAAAAVGLGIAFGGIAAIRRVGPAAVALGVVGLGCLGAAQIIGARWFLPVCGAAAAILLTWFAVWAWKHQKRGDLAEELQTRTAKVAAVAKTAVPVLDDAYESASAETRAWLDDNVFARLSSLMNREEKATVHAIRAEVAPAQ